MGGGEGRRAPMRPLARLGLLAVLTIVAGCANQQPAPGSTWAIDAVDESGTFGTITIERGDVVALPGHMRGAVPGATHGILVNVSYAPDRAGDNGYGMIDWGAAVGDEEVTVGGASFRVFGLDSGVDWPVEGRLGMCLPGCAEPLAGWFLIAVNAAELDGRVTLRYQPLLVDMGNNASDNELVTEVVIHGD